MNIEDLVMLRRLTTEEEREVTWLDLKDIESITWYEVICDDTYILCVLYEEVEGTDVEWLTTELPEYIKDRNDIEILEVADMLKRGYDEGIGWYHA